VTTLEICLEDIAGAAVAEQAGADRIELCTDLGRGGTTPTIDTVAAVLASVSRVGVQVLVRSRPGDFVYTAVEIDGMIRDVETIGALDRPSGVTLGFVIGALTDDQRIDVPALTRLRAACGSAPVTFHRAFDVVADQHSALEELVGLDLDRVLTSGGAPNAEAGLTDLADLVEQARGRISILAAGSVRAHNVADVVRRTGVGEVHLRADQPGGSTSGEVVRAVRVALDQLTRIEIK
jgi:copper homeostasis protein